MRRGHPLTFEQLLACRSVTQFAPRLAGAVRRCREARARRSVLREAVLKRERLVAHRELPWTPENAEANVFLRPDRLDQPLRWRRPRMIFVNSMSDLFHEQVPNEFIAAVFGVMLAAEQHTFQVLTKRPERMKAWFDWYLHEAADREVLDEPGDVALQEARARGVDELHLYGCSGEGWPLRNVWLGVSIENRRYVGRADVLRETPAAVRFISAEPLLGPLVARFAPDGELGEWVWPDGSTDGEGGLDLTDIDWLIVGGESGAGHRPIRPKWARDLRDACRDTYRCRVCGRVYARGALASLPTVLERERYGLRCDCGAPHSLEPQTKFFLKQWGGATPKAGGRELDGRTCDEMPAVAE